MCPLLDQALLAQLAGSLQRARPRSEWTAGAKVDLTLPLAGRQSRVLLASLG